MRIVLATALIFLSAAIPADAQPIYVPRQPIHLCLYRRLPAIKEHGRVRFRVGWTCLPFDARRLLGLSLPEAGAVAGRYGYTVVRERPLGPHEARLLDYNTGRIDVETDAPATESTVIRIIGRG